MHNILIIERDYDQRQLYKSWLSKIGKCHAVSSLQSGLEAFDNNEYSLIISEVSLPDGDGGQLKNAVKKLPKYTPVIFLSPYRIAENLLKASIGRSLFSYLAKPVQEKALIRLAGSVIELARELNIPPLIPSIAKAVVLEGHLLKGDILIEEICLSRSVTIGRKSFESYCDYQIPHQSASRHHATLVRLFADRSIPRSEDSFVLWDGEINGQKSTNGSKINGKKVIYQQLKTGDIIAFPGLVLEYLSIPDSCTFDKNATYLKKKLFLIQTFSVIFFLEFL